MNLDDFNIKLELLTQPNPVGIHPIEGAWRDFARELIFYFPLWLNSDIMTPTETQLQMLKDIYYQMRKQKLKETIQ